MTKPIGDNIKSILIFLAFLLPTWSIRIFCVFEQPTLFHFSGDLARGLISDGFASLLFAFFLVRSPRWILLFFFLVWSFLLAANREFLVVNGTNISPAYLVPGSQWSFLFGSVFVAPLLRCWMTLFLLSLAFLPFIRPQRLPKRLLLLSLLSVLIFVGTFPNGRQGSRWLSENFLETIIKQKVEYLLVTRTREIEVSESAEKKIRDNYLSWNESGTAFRIKHDVAKPNILIVVMESLSEEFLSTAPMPFLSKLSKTGLHYPNFVSSSRQTHTGVHSLFCGEIPNLSNLASKADIVGVRGPSRPCLPQILDSIGYHTVYMQAASLWFMRKDRIASAIGFQDLLDEHDFPTLQRFTDWGPEDVSFLTEVARKAESLSKTSPQPWMIGALTVGAHHPYAVPPGTERSAMAAFRRSDAALEAMYNELERSGVLSNTMLVITTDESCGFGEGNSAQTLLTTNRGFLLILPPETERIAREIDEYHATYDLQGSILDYLGVKSEQLVGRSVFREYHSGFQPILFQQIFFDFLYVWKDEDTLLRCDQRVRSCLHLSLDDPSRGIFHTQFHETPASEEEKTLVRQIVLLSDLKFLKDGLGVVLDDRNLVWAGTHTMFSAMKTNLMKDRLIDYRIRIHANAENKTPLAFTFSLFDYRRPENALVFQSREIAPGKDLDFQWNLLADEDMVIESNARIDTSESSSYVVGQSTILIREATQDEMHKYRHGK